MATNFVSFLFVLSKSERTGSSLPLNEPIIFGC